MQVTALIGKKSYQRQGFLQDGTRVPLTGVLVSKNFITQIKSTDKEGYNALQIGLDSKKKSSKSITNHSKKAGLEKAARFFKEIKVDDIDGATLGSELSPTEVFAPGDIIDVTGTSKGKGWAGGVKRYGFKGGPRTHGQSDRERAPGSIGQTTTPGRVYKGKKMAGRMGTDTVTVKNLEVIEITADGVLLIKGLVPGKLNSLVKVKKTGTNKKFVPLYKEVVEEPTQEIKEEVPQQAAEEPKSEVTEVVKTDSSEEGQTPVVSEPEENQKEPETILAETKVEKELEKPENQVEQKEEVKEDAKS